MGHGVPKMTHMTETQTTVTSPSRTRKPKVRPPSPVLIPFSKGTPILMRWSRRGQWITISTDPVIALAQKLDDPTRKKIVRFDMYNQGGMQHISKFPIVSEDFVLPTADQVRLHTQQMFFAQFNGFLKRWDTCKILDNDEYLQGLRLIASTFPINDENVVKSCEWMLKS